MLLDLLISAPITALLVALQVYFRPNTLPPDRRRLDTILTVLAPLSVVVILVLGHLWIDYPGMGLNVMLVATAYLVLLAVLALGWWLRRR
ncbi:MAG: hypothetical protein RQ729_12010 [Wenzhouxiangellaceae bacterium]|nr:hypothetical protein [Wenzhouxiangellaceae bacterium]